MSGIEIKTELVNYTREHWLDGLAFRVKAIVSMVDLIHQCPSWHDRGAARDALMEGLREVETELSRSVL
jgi:hypothetical protein